MTYFRRLTPLVLVALITLTIPTRVAAADSVTAGTVTASTTTVDVPVYIRDASGSPLGRDQVAGSRIQSFSISVAYSPASAVSAVTFGPSGITAGLTSAFQISSPYGNSISFLDSFQESTNLIPFTLDATAPGDLVAHLVFTLNSSVTPGSTITLTLDPTRTILANQAGVSKETASAGTLTLVSGAINIPAAGLQSIPSSREPASTAPAPTPAPAPVARRPLPSANLIVAPQPSASHLRLQTNSFSTTTNHDSANSYDSSGDVVSASNGNTLTYDGLSMMTGAIVPASPVARSFVDIYTADDERLGLVETTTGNPKTRWALRDLGGHLLRTWVDDATSGTHVWSWSEDEIWRGSTLLANESPAGTKHFGLDHLGSPAVVTKAGGVLVGTEAFDTFGGGGATGSDMLQYTGQERDAYNADTTPSVANLPDYFHARFYNTEEGRFLSVDPVIPKGAMRSPQLWNRYSYARNNPINLVDPTGRVFQIAACANGPSDSCTEAFNLYLSTFEEQSQEAAKHLQLGANGVVSITGMSGAAFEKEFGIMGRATYMLVANRAAVFSLSVGRSAMTDEHKGGYCDCYSGPDKSLGVDPGRTQMLAGVWVSPTETLVHEIGHAIASLIPGVAYAVGQANAISYGMKMYDANYEGYATAFENVWRHTVLGSSNPRTGYIVAGDEYNTTDIREIFP